MNQLCKDGYDILIQSTPVGMFPHSDAMPIPENSIIAGSQVLDVISNPYETKLLCKARLKGCLTYSGIEMFIYQAIEQFRYWFGEHVNDRMIECVMRQHLELPPQKGVAISRSQLSGQLEVPSSKSHSIRAILLGAMANGTSRIRHLLQSPDVDAAIHISEQFGAKFTKFKDELQIQGVGGNPKVPDNVVDVGNSGQVLRFGAALAALASNYTILTGDTSIRNNRPMQPLLDGIQQLEGFAHSSRKNGYAPVIVKGPLKAGQATLLGEDSQPVSALLMAAAFVEGTTNIKVISAGEKPWINLTLSWLDRLQVKYSHDNFESFSVEGKKLREPFTVAIPGDFSSIAFPLVAALVTHSELTIDNVDMQDVQGDKALISILQEMGAQIEIDTKNKCIHVKKGSVLQGRIIDVNPIIDAIPILAVVGCLAKGETRLINGQIARNKESNRIECITSQLKKMGAQIQSTADGLIIQQSTLHGACVKSFDDHRIALSLMVAGLGASGETFVENIQCIEKSYANFIKDMTQLGACLKEFS